MSKINKSGISIGSIIRAEHLLRIINALSGEVPNTQIEVSGSVTASFFVGDGSQLTNIPTGSGGIAGGSDTQIQFNSGSTFQGDSSFRFIYTSQSLEQGDGIIASGQYSHAEGQNTISSGDYSHAEGGSVQASGNYSHAEGVNSVSLGEASHAEGNDTQAIGEGSHAEGYNSIASGNYSHAEGNQSLASGSYSHAEGFDTKAKGSYSHTEGLQTEASGAYSHAEGVRTRAIGDYTHTEGYATEALGEYSHAEGLETITSGSYQHVQGQYNAPSTIQSAFIIGNGEGTGSRSNLIFAAGNQVDITGSLAIRNLVPTITLTSTGSEEGRINFQVNNAKINWTGGSFNITYQTSSRFDLSNNLTQGLKVYALTLGNPTWNNGGNSLTVAANTANGRALIGAFTSSVSTYATASARLHVRGEGTTSSTTSFLIENETRETIVRVLDDKNVIITGSVNISQVLTLAPLDPLPLTSPTGSIAVSGSGVDCKPYFWNGTWNALF